jgi:hypothetical protein
MRERVEGRANDQRSGAGSRTRTGTALRPRDFHLTIAFATGIPFVSWTLSLPYRFRLRQEPSSLYTFLMLRLRSALSSAPPVKSSPNLTPFTRQVSPSGAPLEVPCVYQFHHTRKVRRLLYILFLNHGQPAYHTGSNFTSQIVHGQLPDHYFPAPAATPFPGFTAAQGWISSFSKDLSPNHIAAKPP